MKLGLLDLPAPLLSVLDDGLAAIGLPAVLRVVFYGLFSAWVCMALYRRWSRQTELADLAIATRALRADLASYDGPFDGLLVRVRRLLGLSARHLRLSFTPALLGGLPLLLLLPWISNHFGAQFPLPGSVTQIKPVAFSTAVESFTWTGAPVQWSADTQTWQVKWPSVGESIELNEGNLRLLTLPLAAPAEQVHKRIAVFNWLIANPAGYLPSDASLSVIELHLPTQRMFSWGPVWLRAWPTPYFGALVLFSLFLRWRWKLQ